MVLSANSQILFWFKGKLKPALESKNEKERERVKERKTGERWRGRDLME